MYTATEQHKVEEQNTHCIRELRRISYGLGINLTAPSRLKNSLRYLNLSLIILSCLSLYGNWCVIHRLWGNVAEVSESVCTAVQTVISVVKMVYCLGTERRFAKLLQQAVSHQLIQESEVYRMDIPMQQEIRHKTGLALDAKWKAIRRQLLYYICSCSAICSHYFIRALWYNLHQQWQGNRNFQPQLPVPAAYDIWADSGMSFPYYHIQLLLSSSALYISGMCAISFDGVFIVLCLHCVSLVEVLKVCIGYADSPLLTPEQREVYLRCCIYQYQRISDYMQQVQKMYKHVSLTQFTLSLVVWAIVLFQISIGLESDRGTVIRMLMYIAAAGFQIVIYCNNGQGIATATAELPLAFYSCSWYNQTPAFRQLIYMSIMRCNKHFEFDISWFATMTLGTLMAMIKASGSYFVLLRDLDK